MKVGLSLPQISFKSGEINHKFDKELKNAVNNGSNAQYLLRMVDEDMLTFSEERLEKVKKAMDESKTPSAKYYFKMLIETWEKNVKH
jgi:hypothetical protein